MPTPRKSPRKRKVEKPLKRLNTNLQNKHNRLLPTPDRRMPPRPLQMHQPVKQNSFEKELAEFAALRKSDSRPSTSAATSLAPLTCDEILWIRDDSGNQKQVENSNLPTTSDHQQPILIDDEIEDGEIVESEVDGIVNLLQESLAVMNQSRLIKDDPKPEELFFEDRTSSKYGQVPKYNTFGLNDTPKEANTSAESDVICMDVSKTEDMNDSVIFVSEERLNNANVSPLAPPDCLKSPAVKNLFNLFPSSSTRSQAGAKKSPVKAKKKIRAGQKIRFMLWKEKKAKEFPAGKTAKKLNRMSADVELDDHQNPSTVSDSLPTSKVSAEQEKLKLWKLQKSAEMSVATTTDKKISDSGSAPEAEVKLPENGKSAVNPKMKEKRIILIDGSNVAMAFTDSCGTKKTDKDFSAEGKSSILVSTFFISNFSVGLKICINHFEEKGFQVKAIVPEYRVRRDKSSNHIMMTELKETGKLICTPSKSYDDRVILQAATQLDAAVVSNDHYRKLKCFFF